MCPQSQGAAMLRVENPGNSKRRSNGADDEITGCNFEGVSEEDQLDGGGGGRGGNGPDDAADSRAVSGVRVHGTVRSKAGKAKRSPDSDGNGGRGFAVVSGGLLR